MSYKNPNILPRALSYEEKENRKKGIYDSFANYLVYCQKCKYVAKSNMYIQRAEAYTMQGNTDAAQADLDTAASLGADTTAAEETLAALTPEPTSESTAAPEEKKIEHPREFRFTASYKGSGSDGDFFYDEDGRLTHITLDGFDIYIDYTDGKASAAFDEAQVNAMDDPHYILEIHEMTLKADGTIDTLYAYLPDVFAYIEFNEDGLPSYFTIAQDDLGHLITYTRTEDGRLAMDSVQYVYGYMDNHVAEPVEDYHTVSGEVIY